MSVENVMTIHLLLLVVKIFQTEPPIIRCHPQKHAAMRNEKTTMRGI